MVGEPALRRARGARMPGTCSWRVWLADRGIELLAAVRVLRGDEILGVDIVDLGGDRGRQGADRARTGNRRAKVAITSAP